MAKSKKTEEVDVVPVWSWREPSPCAVSEKELQPLIELGFAECVGVSYIYAVYSPNMYLELCKKRTRTTSVSKAELAKGIANPWAVLRIDPKSTINVADVCFFGENLQACMRYAEEQAHNATFELLAKHLLPDLLKLAMVLKVDNGISARMSHNPRRYMIDKLQLIMDRLGLSEARYYEELPGDYKLLEKEVNPPLEDDPLEEEESEPDEDEDY